MGLTMMQIKDQFNEFSLSVMSLQDHALSVNEHKQNGMNDVQIDTYLNLIDSVINYMYQVDDYVTASEEKANSQTEQIDRLLDYMNENLKI